MTSPEFRDTETVSLRAMRPGLIGFSLLRVRVFKVRVRVRVFRVKKNGACAKIPKH